MPGPSPSIPTKVIGDKLALARRLAELMPEQSEEQYFALLARASRSSISAAAPRPTLVEAVNALGEPGLAIEREPDRLYPQTTPCRARPRLHRHRRPRRRRRRARVRQISVRSRDPRQAAGAVDLQPRSSRRSSMSCGDAMTTFLGDRRGRRGDGRPHRRSAGDDLAAGAQSQRAGPGHARGAMFNRATLGVFELGSTFKPFTRRDGDGLAASSRASARSTIARNVLAGLRPRRPRHASVRPHLLGRRDHDGKLEHRHGADRRPARHRRGRRRGSRRWASSTRSRSSSRSAAAR